MAVGNPARDGPAQARSARGRIGRPPEAIEDVWQVLDANARSGVLHLEARARADLHPNGSALRALADRVIDENAR